MLDIELVCACKIHNTLKIVFCYICVFPRIREITLVTYYCNMHFRRLFKKKKIYALTLIHGYLEMCSAVCLPTLFYVASFYKKKKVLNATGINRLYFCTLVE